MTIIQEYYNNGVNTEWVRMDRHPLEFEITKRNLDESIPPKSKIADIGGGPGKYSFYLASIGHNVTLIDLAEKNIEFAKEKGKEIGIKLENYIHANILEIEPFMQQFSLQMLKISGAEGLGCQSEEILKLLPKEKLKEWIDFFYLHGSDPSILGANQHIIYIGKKIP